jgi:hypothetical protein
VTDVASGSQLAQNAVVNNQLWSMEGHKRLSPEAKKLNDYLIQQAGGVKGLEYYSNELKKIQNSKLSSSEKDIAIAKLKDEYKDESRRYEQAIMNLPRGSKARELYRTELIPKMLPTNPMQDIFTKDAMQEWTPGGLLGSTTDRIEKEWKRKDGEDPTIVDYLDPALGSRGPGILGMTSSGVKLKFTGSFLTQPKNGGVLNIGAGTKPLEGAYNISHPDYPMGRGVFAGDAGNLSNIKTGSQKTIVMDNPYGYEPLNSEVLRVLRSDGQVIVRGNISNKNIKNIEKQASEKGLLLVSRKDISSAGYTQSNGSAIKSEKITEYIFKRK